MSRFHRRIVLRHFDEGAQLRFTARIDADGRFWPLVGNGSGLQGLMALHSLRIDVELLPVAAWLPMGDRRRMRVLRTYQIGLDLLRR